MDQKLRGKRALVTGSSSGIGEAIAKQLAAEGALVVVHGRSGERTRDVASAICAMGSEVFFVTGDLAQDDQANAIADKIVTELGGIDILVNNAGGEASGGGNAAWLEATPEEWVTAYQGNVVSSVRMIRHFAPGMKERGWGRIIQISSIVGHSPQVVIPDYAAAKAALINLTVGLSRALANTGITSNSISPGLILTPSIEAWLRGLAKQFGWGDDWEEIEKRAIAEFVPNKIGRIGRPEDIAHAVSYLASHRAGFVTGTDMKVCGGQ